jgi:hypothetical protein
LTYNSDKILNPVIPDDFFKLFSPYYKKNRSKHKRTYVGIACYDDSNAVFDSTNLSVEYPKNKFYPVENYSDIFKIIKSAGYDVITFDSKLITKTNKAWMLENLCECVIGYEGGIAHLCHMLSVPYIMLPWRNNSGLEQLLHLDNTVYFLSNIDELLSWGDNEQNLLSDMIYKLNTGQGNNKFLSKIHNLVIKDNFKFFDTSDTPVPIMFNDSEKEFFQQYLNKLKLGGNE